MGEGALQRREGHIHDREVEGGHEGAERGDEENGLAPRRVIRTALSRTSPVGSVIERSVTDCVP